MARNLMNPLQNLQQQAKLSTLESEYLLEQKIEKLSETAEIEMTKLSKRALTALETAQSVLEGNLKNLSNSVEKRNRELLTNSQDVEKRLIESTQKAESLIQSLEQTIHGNKKGDVVAFSHYEP